METFSDRLYTMIHIRGPVKPFTRLEALLALLPAIVLIFMAIGVYV